MEEAPNNRNALASLTEDVILEILRRLPAYSLFCCKCVCCSWNRLISDNRKVLPQTMADFFYDGKNGKRNLTSVTGECSDMSLLPFLRDNVALLDCCDGLVLCLCIEVVGSHYVVCNLATKTL
ncbi:F-box protein At5g49610-like [Miscanthus floridulus]|uniref:F-box protein At5g49610-like n=1 Tax=Miscanthus floridulus TaxID=154761 RepID=UPI00345A722D